MAAGIRTRHGRSCRTREGGRCNCRPSYEAWVYSKRDGKKIRKTFENLAEAKGLGAPMPRAPFAIARSGHLRSGRSPRAADEWLEGARREAIRTRSGDPYKPSAIRTYETALKLRVLPELGGARLADVTRVDLQLFVDRLLEDKGLDPSTVHTSLLPLRAIYARAMDRGEVAVNPTSGVRLPRVQGKRDRIASPAEATRLLDALPEKDRPLWATAMYAGLRRGELMALRWTDVDLAAGVLRVERSWDIKAGFIEPKSNQGRRTVPIPAVLGDPELPGYLVQHRIRATDPEGLVFGRGSEPFARTTVRKRARKAWADAGLDPITLHEARHTFASLMIAAGVNAKALSTYMGHANISITLDRYGHLMPGNEAEAASLLDAYLSAAAEDE